MIPLSKRQEKDIELAEKELGLLVRKYRLRRGYSQAKLATLANVDQSVIGKMETGDRVGSPSTLIVIARALEIRPGVLLDTLAGLEIAPEEAEPEARHLIELYAALDPEEREYVREGIELFYRRHKYEEALEEVATAEGFVQGVSVSDSDEEDDGIATIAISSEDLTETLDRLDAAVEAEEAEENNNKKKTKDAG